MERLTSSSSSESDEDIVQVRLARVFKERPNLSLNFTDFVFKEKFRISKVSVEYILQRIGGYLVHPTRRNKALEPLEQLLCALHWMGCGAQYHVGADALGLSKATVYRCVKLINELLVEHLLGEEVRWPTVNALAVPQMFMRYANFPRVAGVVDGSLVKIDAPHENEMAFVDRNGNHSINIMVVSGPNLEFFYASARWPGSVHDARVLRVSSLAQRWEDGWRPFPKAVILGDSGYGLRKWLLTPNMPIEIPPSEAVNRFLRAFKSTRRTVENSLGILKEKFPCLNHMRMQPLPACNVALGCIILHNLEKRFGSELYEPYDDAPFINEANENEDHGNEEVVDAEAIEVLQELIQFFNA